MLRVLHWIDAVCVAPSALRSLLLVAMVKKQKKPRPALSNPCTPVGPCAHCKRYHVYENGGVECHHPGVQDMDRSLKLTIALVFMNEQILQLTNENARLRAENARLKGEALANSVAEDVLADPNDDC